MLLFRKSSLLLVGASIVCSLLIVDTGTNGVAALSPRRRTARVPPSAVSRKKVPGHPTGAAAVSTADGEAPLARLASGRTPRGGAAAAGAPQRSDVPTRQELTGVALLILIEVAFRRAFRAGGIRFPAQLAGCVALLAALVVADRLPGIQGVGDGAENALCRALAPGAGLLAKWMGVFFVPGLTMLPLAPLEAVGSGAEAAKALGIVVVGFFYSLALVTYSVLGVRKLTGQCDAGGEGEGDGAPVAKDPAVAAAVVKPYAADTQRFLIAGAVASAVASLAAIRLDSLAHYQKPLEFVFLLFTTLASYVWGARLPGPVTAILNPLLTSAGATVGVAGLLGRASGRTLVEVLRGYTAKTLAPRAAGAGDLLLFLLSPAVISFAVGVYRGRALVAANLPAVAAGVASGSVGSLFGTAAACRLLNLGGPRGAVLRLAAVPRSTQTALGMVIAGMLGGDVGIAATLIVLTGIFGGTVGVGTLDAWGVRDPVARGLGLGSAGLSLGVVSIKGEPQAFAFAGVCLVLTAVMSTCLVSVPAVANALKSIAGGSVTVVAAAAAESPAL